MTSIARTSDYFYLSQYSHQQLQQPLADFFSNYLPLSSSRKQGTVRSISLLSAAFYTCWHVSKGELVGLLYYMCSGADWQKSSGKRHNVVIYKD